MVPVAPSREFVPDTRALGHGCRVKAERCVLGNGDFKASEFREVGRPVDLLCLLPGYGEFCERFERDTAVRLPRGEMRHEFHHPEGAAQGGGVQSLRRKAYAFSTKAARMWLCVRDWMSGRPSKLGLNATSPILALTAWLRAACSVLPGAFRPVFLKTVSSCAVDAR